MSHLLFQRFSTLYSFVFFLFQSFVHNFVIAIFTMLWTLFGFWHFTSTSSSRIGAIPHYSLISPVVTVPDIQGTFRRWATAWPQGAFDLCTDEWELVCEAGLCRWTGNLSRGNLWGPLNIPQTNTCLCFLTSLKPTHVYASHSYILKP